MCVVAERTETEDIIEKESWCWSERVYRVGRISWAREGRACCCCLAALSRREASKGKQAQHKSLGRGEIFLSARLSNTVRPLGARAPRNIWLFFLFFSFLPVSAVTQGRNSRWNQTTQGTNNNTENKKEEPTEKRNKRKEGKNPWGIHRSII